jgi:hypothetical protein
VNLEDNTTDAQALTVVGATGLNDGLAVSGGNPLNNGGFEIGAIIVTGDELFTFTALGSGGESRLITLTPTLGGNEQVTLGGDSLLGVTLADATGGVLNVNNMVITVTNTGKTYLDAEDGTVLDFVTDAGANGGKFAPLIENPTNAMTIDASTSGGLVMRGGDANVDPATGLGAVIIDAEHPVPDSFSILPFGDQLVGSIGNDSFISKSLVLPDFIYTQGGADTITLAAGHVGADHVGFYAQLIVSEPEVISEDVSGFEFANPGWWGIGAEGSSTKIAFGGGLFGGVATGTGTSADNSTLNGYVAGQDFLDFAPDAWGGGLGLTADKAGALVPSVGADLTHHSITAVSAALVAPGDSISGAGSVDFIVLSQGTFFNAAAVAAALSNGSYTIHHSTLLTGTDADFLVAYAGTDNNAHIADLHLSGKGVFPIAGSAGTDSDGSVYASDIVTLVGVSLAQLETHIDHIEFVI